MRMMSGPFNATYQRYRVVYHMLLVFGSNALAVAVIIQGCMLATWTSMCRQLTCMSSTCGVNNQSVARKRRWHGWRGRLGDVHSADYNTLRRAYVSLVQHFRALQVEAQVKLYTPHDVADHDKELVMC